MTTCRPAAMQASAWRTPATGSPVASTTTSGSPWRITLSASGNKPSAAISASLQPDRRNVACARSGARSHTPTTRMPGVVRTCARNMDANLPAPITATRTGSDARALRSRYMPRLRPVRSEHVNTGSGYGEDAPPRCRSSQAAPKGAPLGIVAPKRLHDAAHR